jgi:hypothetical protein
MVSDAEFATKASVRRFRYALNLSQQEHVTSNAGNQRNIRH